MFLLVFLSAPDFLASILSLTLPANRNIHTGQIGSTLLEQKMKGRREMRSMPGELCEWESDEREAHLVN